jgi:hypothetical protein
MNVPLMQNIKTETIQGNYEMTYTARNGILPNVGAT